MRSRTRRARRTKDAPPTLLKQKIRRTNGRVDVYAYAVFAGEERRYGRFDDEARQLFDEDLATWLANGRGFPAEAVADDVPESALFTVHALREGFLHHIRTHRTERWLANNEPRYTSALDALDGLFGETPAATFGPKRLKAVREHLLSLKRKDRTTPRLTVRTVNERMSLVRAAFAWAVSEELVPPAVLEGLRAVDTVERDRVVSEYCAELSRTPFGLRVSRSGGAVSPTSAELRSVWTDRRPGSR